MKKPRLGDKSPGPESGVLIGLEPGMPCQIRAATHVISAAQSARAIAQVSLAVSAVHWVDTQVPAYATEAITAIVMMPMRIVYSSMVTPSSLRKRRVADILSLMSMYASCCRGVAFRPGRIPSRDAFG